jgi:C4-dicarboxylate-specific signal transduction histidine kinase
LTWVFVVLAPILGVGITATFPALHSVPYSISFIAICLIAGFAGFKPGIASALIAISANVFLHVFVQHLSLTKFDTIRTLGMLSAALVVCWLLESRRKAHQLSHRASAALQDRNDALVDSLHAGKCASWVIDLNSGKSARWFSGSYQVFGIPFSELEQHASLVQFVDPEDRPGFYLLVAEMKSSRNPIVFEYRSTWPNGEQHWHEMRATRVPGDVGCVWRGVTMDVTDRKRAESVVLRQEKLAATGRMASTVAHEINNPLEAVTNLLYLANLDQTLTPATKSYLGMAEAELARLGEITRLTLGYARNTTVKESVVLGDVVEDVLKIFRHRYQAKNIQISRRFNASVRIWIAPHELRQILTNLITNAADAVSNNASADRRIEVEVSSEGSRTILAISDNGSGVSPEALPHIFEPFFTTKGDIGTGIGLWVTRELVENNGGIARAESGDLGNGMKTRLHIEFPIVDAGERSFPLDVVHVSGLQP